LGGGNINGKNFTENLSKFQKLIGCSLAQIGIKKGDEK
jgi:hypothetical protein